MHSHRIVVAAFLLIAGCDRFHSPTEPMPFACDSAVRGLSANETYAVQSEAREEIRTALDNGTLTAPKSQNINWPLPKVDYVACDWWDGHQWVAGESDLESWRVKIKTNEPARTAPLVRWETINCYLMAIGRSDLGDVWQGNHH